MVQVCKRCLMLSTRPRLTFDSEGVCSACRWAEEKRTVVDWKKRKEDLYRLCDKYRSKSGDFDVIVPVSGGKDSSTVADKIKNECGMHPLCVNINHSIQCNTKANELNLNNFIQHGFNCLRVYPAPEILQYLDTVGLKKYGNPYFGWLGAMMLTPLILAVNFHIPFIMYGEEGEVEYGGSTKLKDKLLFDLDDVKTFYLSGLPFEEDLKSCEVDTGKFWWTLPAENELRTLQPALAHWSTFEPWDSNANCDYAREHFGLFPASEPVPGTYVQFAQTDSILYPLHAYFMYLKFGFGRCSQDVSIDIRSGRLTREEGVKLVLQYDEEYPEVFEDQYLDYYRMDRASFHQVIDAFANKDLLEKKNGGWVKKAELRNALSQKE